MTQARDLRISAAYAGSSLRTRLHTRLRWAAAPLPAIETLLPSSGRILEVGCGHGLFSILAALESPHREVVAVDIDDRKIADARDAAEQAGLPTDRLRFDVVAPDWVPASGATWDAVAIIDVLYLLGRDRALRLLDAAAGSLAQGGRAVVKEVDTARRARTALLDLEEHTMRRLGMTRGNVIEMLPIDTVERRMRSAGLTTTRSDLSRGFHVPHCVVVGDRNRDEMAASPPTTPVEAAGDDRRPGPASRERRDPAHPCRTRRTRP